MVKKLINDKETKDYKLILLVRSISKAKSIFLDEISKNVLFLEGSLDSFKEQEFRDKNENILCSVNIIVHLAAEMDFYPDNIEYLYRVNVEGTQNILNCFSYFILEKKMNDNLKKIIYCSSTEVIGPSNRIGKDRNIKANEDIECLPSYEYGKTKILAENIIRKFSNEYNILSLILRPTGIYGPNDRFTIWELQKMIEYGLLFFIPGSGCAKLMYTHINDVIDSFYLSILFNNNNNNNSITMNICPNNALTYSEWIKLISKLLNRHEPIIHLPFPIVKFGTWILSFIMNIGKKRKFMYKPKTIDRMKEDRYYSNEKAKKILNFNPKYSIYDGITETVTYNIEKGYLKRYFISPFFMIILITIFIILIIFFTII